MKQLKIKWCNLLDSLKILKAKFIVSVDFYERINSVSIEFEDIINECYSNAEKILNDPERLEYVNTKRKPDCTIKITILPKIKQVFTTSIKIKLYTHLIISFPENNGVFFFY